MEQIWKKVNKRNQTDFLLLFHGDFNGPPVVDQANYIDEIHYKIGNRVYIENAD
jgi:hypothetical protein